MNKCWKNSFHLGHLSIFVSKKYSKVNCAEKTHLSTRDFTPFKATHFIFFLFSVHLLAIRTKFFPLSSKISISQILYIPSTHPTIFIL